MASGKGNRRTHRNDEKIVGKPAILLLQGRGYPRRRRRTSFEVNDNVCALKPEQIVNRFRREFYGHPAIVCTRRSRDRSSAQLSLDYNLTVYVCSTDFAGGCDDK